MSKKELAALEQNWDLLLEATRRERDLTSSRAAATQTRASILVGAASLVAGATSLSSSLALIPAIPLVLAVALGIWGLIPTFSTPVPVRTLRDTQNQYTPVDMREQILGFEIDADDDAAKVIAFRSRLVVGGFIALVIGVVLSAVIGIATIMNPIPESPIEIQSPIRIQIEE